jgi:hypothetical protein
MTAKMGAERLRDYLLDIAKRAMAPDFRDLTRIVDQSNLGKLGHDAIQQIIRGAVLIGCVTTYTDSQKDFIGRQKSSRGGIRGSKARVKNKMTWQDHVRKRVAELHRNKSALTGTFIRDSIKREPPPGVHLPNDRTLYEFILAELNNLKRGPGAR